MSTKQQTMQENQLNSLSKQQMHSVFSKSVESAPEISQYLTDYPELFTEERIAPQNPESNKPVDSNDVFVPNPPPYQSKFQDKTVKKIPVVSKSPFTNSKLIADPSEKVWQYLDEQQKIKGPFSSTEMDLKYDNSQIGNPLRIRYQEAQEFVKLVDLFGKIEEVPVIRAGNQEKNDPNHNKKGQTNVNIWEKIKPGNGTAENKPQNQSDSPVKTIEDIGSKDSKSKLGNNANLSGHPQEETKANEIVTNIKHSQSDPVKSNVSIQKPEEKTKNVEENKIEKIEDKNQKNLNNISSVKSEQEHSSQPETTQESENKPVTPVPRVIDWSQEPSLLQTSNVQANDEEQGEWKISTLGKSKKKKGKKGKGQSEDPAEPMKAEPENKVTINPEPKLPEPIQKVQEVKEEVKTPVIEKIPTPEPVIEKVEPKVEEVIEPIKESENPKKTNEPQESVKAQAAEKSKNPKPAKKRVIAAWTTEEKSEDLNKAVPATQADEQDFPSLGGQIKPTKAKLSQAPVKSEEKEEKKQEIKPTVSASKSESISKPVESKTTYPQNIPKTQAKPAPKIKGTDWGNPPPNSKKEQKTNNGDKYEAEFPSL